MGNAQAFDAADGEKRILDTLAERPHTAAELAHRTGRGHWTLLSLGRLEDQHLVQRCGLTPTDLLHATGRFTRWDSAAAGRACSLFSTAIGRETRQFIEDTLEQVVHRLALELVKKLMAESVDPDAAADCPLCREILSNLLSGGGAELAFRAELKHPVIGIGAPVHYFLPKAGRLLHAEVIVPHDADVANAIGAVTSLVTVARTVRIRPDENGRFVVDGLSGAPVFDDLESAHRHATGELETAVLAAARESGTRETSVQMRHQDHVAAASDGTELFLERTLTARVSGRPDGAQTEPGSASIRPGSR